MRSQERATATKREGEARFLQHQPDWHQLTDGSWVFLPVNDYLPGSEVEFDIGGYVI